LNSACRVVATGGTPVRNDAVRPLLPALQPRLVRSLGLACAPADRQRSETQLHDGIVK